MGLSKADAGVGDGKQELALNMLYLVFGGGYLDVKYVLFCYLIVSITY